MFISLYIYFIKNSENTCLDVEAALKMCDQNTIGIVAILGSTYTGRVHIFCVYDTTNTSTTDFLGEFDDIDELNRKLDELNREKGWKIPIHVDGASGAYV